MQWIGLTGGIATGKTTVAQTMRAAGLQVLDADKVAHQALVASSPLRDQIVQNFGSDILATNGDVDRIKLGHKVFRDPVLLQKLESLVHPFVKKQIAMERERAEKAGIKILVYDVPLLFEKNMQKEFSKIIVVSCAPQIQLQRLMERNKLSKSEAELRLAQQLPLSEKIKQADFVIENNGDLNQLKKATEAVLAKIKKG